MMKCIRQQSLLFVVLTFFLIVSIPASAQQGVTGRVARAYVTTAIESREPVDQVLVIDSKTSELFFFSELINLTNQKISHKWVYEDRLVSKKTFNVNGARWRVYSQVSLPANSFGTWSVIISDEDNWPLKTVIFKYVKEGDLPVAILPLK